VLFVAGPAVAHFVPQVVSSAVDRGLLPSHAVMGMKMVIRFDMEALLFVP
jgi:hypothetical protein